MEFRSFIVSICLILAAGAIWAQDKEPGLNEFIFVDAEPRPKNIGDIRNEIGYPQEAIEKNIEGTVVVRILVDKEGNYVKHNIVRPVDSSFVAAIEPHLSKLTFSPALLNGEPMMYWVNMPFPFKLLGNEDVARQNIEKLTDELTVDAENYEIWHKRGIQRSQVGELEDALADFNESIRLNPKKNKKKAKKNTYAYLFYAHYGRATVHFGMEKFEDALADFTQALTYAQDMAIEDSGVTASLASVYLERGYTYAQVEKYTESKADFKKTIELDAEQKCSVLPLLVDVGLAEDNAKELVEYYSGIIECEPDDVLNYFSRGYYKSESGDYAGAIEDLEITSEKTDNINVRIAAANGIGLAHMRAGDLEKAKEGFTRANRINVLSPMPYFHLAQLAEKMEDEAAACDNYKKALTFDIDGEKRQTAIEFMKASCGGWDED